jgi:hypothetical protein
LRKKALQLLKDPRPVVVYTETRRTRQNKPTDDGYTERLKAPPEPTDNDSGGGARSTEDNYEGVYRLRFIAYQDSKGDTDRSWAQESE